MFFLPRRLKKLEGCQAVVDNISFTLPVRCEPSPVLMAAFPINADKAKLAMPSEIHPLRLWNGKSVLLVSVINYLGTDIGKYIEYSIGIPCTHGLKPAPRLIPALFQKIFKTGQFVIDLPVSTEVSVKGGKGIWGMPKHIGNLNFRMTEEIVTSQYDLDGKLVCYIEMEKPGKFNIPFRMSAANFCAFRGMLMRSDIFFKGNVHPGLGKSAKAKIILGDHPRADILHSLEIEEKPMVTAFIPNAIGTLDDHFQSWFISETGPNQQPMEGLDSVYHLGYSQEWPAPPNTIVRKEVEEKKDEKAA